METAATTATTASTTRPFAASESSAEPHSLGPPVSPSFGAKHDRPLNSNQYSVEKLRAETRVPLVKNRSRPGYEGRSIPPASHSHGRTAPVPPEGVASETDRAADEGRFLEYICTHH